MLLYLTVSRILIMDTQLGIFHTLHESEDNLHPFVESMVKFHENVTTYLFKELLLEETSKIEKDYKVTMICPFDESDPENTKNLDEAICSCEW